MNEPGKSDRPVVPEKPANKSFWTFVRSLTERVEGRGLAKEKEEGEALLHAEPANRSDGTQSPVGEGAASQAPVSNLEGPHAALDRIRQAARRDKGLTFTNLWHHVYDLDRLRQAFFTLKKQAAAGVDGQTWHAYAEDLEANLRDLQSRLIAGSYRARPVKRVFIPKGDGTQRPIGIPVLEDKLVQRAAVMVLNAVYEEDFLGFSYGFRPGKSAHLALDALAVGIQTKKVNWLLDADIKSFFDSLSHDRLIELLQRRIADPRVIRHVKKWLTAGVMDEAGKHQVQDEGTPQGGSISPFLANLYLHYVLDEWAEQWRRTQAQGDVIIVRYADDFVVGFQHESDANRFHEELRARFRQFNLALHAAKTRVIEFGRFAAERRKRRGDGKPQTFDFLGFTHICDKTRKDGRFVVLRRTMARRLRAKLKQIKVELRRRMHEPVSVVGGWLASVLRGHYRYYGVPRNYPALDRLRDRIRHLWRRALSQRSQRGYMTEAAMTCLARRWLPRPAIGHPYPEARLRVIIQGKSPVR
jgi:group II intron reverse transcriptase/maturase